MKKVYVVTSSCYSDYQIEAIFSNKEKATKFIETSKMHSPDAEIEEYEINKSPSDFIYIIIGMKRNRDTIKSHRVFNSQIIESFRDFTIDDELI